MIKQTLKLTFFFFLQLISQVGKFIQYVACFFGGIAIAFIKGWLLSLVLLSSLPLLVLSGSVMSFAFAKMASRGQTAYSEAATVVERTIGSIRTVCQPSECTFHCFSYSCCKRVVDKRYTLLQRRLHHLRVRSKLELNTTNT